jgi:acyl-homoserine-lactone acylase
MTSRAYRSFLLTLAALGVAGWAGPGLAGDDHGGNGNRNTYVAELYRTQGHIPNIVADDWASLGFGTGYAVAEDSFCVVMQDYVRHAAQLSLYFGPGNGNLSSDFFYQLLLDRDIADQSIDEEIEKLYRGWAAGFNRYLRDQGGKNGLPDVTCSGATWVREISAREVKHLNLVDFFLPNLIGFLVAAQPPAPTAQLAPPTRAHADELMLALEPTINPADKGSNGLAIGRDATRDGTGMLLANPHFPPTGANRRFYPFHQILRGELNLQGANILSRAMLVGFANNGHVATTATVSTGQRFTFYQLLLAGPTTYLFDGTPTPMTSETVTVAVRNADDTLSQESHTFWSTHFGPMVGASFLPWTDQIAFAVRSAGEGGRGLNGGSLAYARARTVRELKAAHDQYQTLPANLVAADDTGETLYAEPGPVANVPDAKAAACSAFFGVALQGWLSSCQWDIDPDAAAEGLYGPSNLPSLFRTDYVSNSNDTYWLANPSEPLTGFNSNLGVAGLEQSMRTRSGNRMIGERLAGSDGLSGTKFSLRQLQTLAFDNQHLAGQILRDDLVTLCNDNPVVTFADDTTEDVSEACPILESWDLKADLDSRGAHVMREFIAAAHGGSTGQRRLPGSLVYATPFDPSSPLTTPAGLDTTHNPAALEALGTAVRKLRGAGIALDARLGDIQKWTSRGDIPAHGGPESMGVYNKIAAPFDAAAGGYPEVTGSGSSWVMVTEFTDDGPVSRGILTYSISTDPGSPHFSDQTQLFSDKQWLDLPYYTKDVKKSAHSSMRLEEGKGDCESGGWEDFTEPSFDNQGQCVRYFNKLRESRSDEISQRGDDDGDDDDDD